MKRDAELLATFQLNQCQDAAQKLYASSPLCFRCMTGWRHASYYDTYRGEGGGYERTRPNSKQGPSYIKHLRVQDVCGMPRESTRCLHNLSGPDTAKISPTDATLSRMSQSTTTAHTQKLEENMKSKNLEGMRVAILATDDFEEAELVEPRKALDNAGAKTTVLAPKAGKIQAMKHDEKTIKIVVDRTLDEADADDFDAVLLPGGALNADGLRVAEPAQEFVRSIDEAGKPIAVICHAPWLLVSADLVDGRTITSYHTIQDDIRNAGGNWVEKEVVRDENWVSSRQPSDIPAFNREMIKLFREQREKSEQAA